MWRMKCSSRASTYDTGGDSSQWKGKDGITIQLLRPKTWESFWISPFPYPPHLTHWKILLASYSYSKYIQSLTTTILVQVTIISYLNQDNSLLTGLSASTFAFLVYFQRSSQINLLKICQNISPPSLKPSMVFQCT